MDPPVEYNYKSITLCYNLNEFITDKSVHEGANGSGQLIGPNNNA